MSEETKIINTKVIQIVEDERNPQNNLPQLQVNLSPANLQKPDEKAIISNDQMVDLYQEILGYCRDDRKDADGAFKDFMDMIINNGDATSSTKESMVQLLRIRVEATDKMTKVMDLLMRYVLKDKDTFPRYLAANQENNIIVKGKNNRRSFLEKLGKQVKDKEEKK